METYAGRTDAAGSAALDTRRIIESGGAEVIESVFTFAQPSGRTLRAFYEEMRDRILADLGAAQPVDAVLLWLHGAMVAVGHDDCEGDILRRVRELVGAGTPIGAVLGSAHSPHDSDDGCGRCAGVR